MRSIEWWHFQWPWRTPNPVSRSRHFWSWISRKQCVLEDIFPHWISQKWHSQSHRMCCITWWHFQWPWWTA